MSEKQSFDIEKSLGKGSFGEVFKVTSKKDGKNYALKMIELKGKVITYDAVAKEVNFMQNIDHPNIVKFINVFQTEESETSVKFAIQLEYCEKGDLDKLITNRQGRKFSSRIVQKWMLELSYAIGYIHSKGIMHRDLKPGNIFLDQHSSIKIGDFGIARDVLHSYAGTKIGTVIFMAPETSIGKYYIEADIYSLGCVFLCIVLARRIPKDSKGDHLPLPATITYGEIKTSFIRRCLLSDKTKRPTALEMYTKLQYDCYERLCFHEVRSSNTLSSVNKMVASRKAGEDQGAFIFSNRCLNQDEKFSLSIQKIRKPGLSMVIFGFTATDPQTLKGKVPCTVRELKVMSQSYFQKVEMPLEENTKFSFWFEEDGAVVCQYKQRITKGELDVPASTKLWAFINIYQEMLQVQLTDYS